MDILAIIALVNVILWGAAFAVLWRLQRSEAELDAQITALEERFERRP